MSTSLRAGAAGNNAPVITWCKSPLLTTSLGSVFLPVPCCRLRLLRWSTVLAQFPSDCTNPTQYRLTSYIDRELGLQARMVDDRLMSERQWCTGGYKVAFSLRPSTAIVCPQLNVCKRGGQSKISSTKAFNASMPSIWRHAMAVDGPAVTHALQT